MDFVQVSGFSHGVGSVQLDQSIIVVATWHVLVALVCGIAAGRDLSFDPGRDFALDPSDSSAPEVYLPGKQALSDSQVDRASAQSGLCLDFGQPQNPCVHSFAPLIVVSAVPVGSTQFRL